MSAQNQTPASEFLYIDTREALIEFCNHCQSAPVLFIDTEFIREKTYYPKLCLIQVATHNTMACIDPLALDSLEPFLEVLYNPDIIKVLHAARQDLEIFYNLRNELPKPVFDTQIAAAILGHPDQIGYGNLVKAICSVTLDKKYARTDWAQRPLGQDQLEYAINDVRYLRDVYASIYQTLQQQQRIDWLQEDFNNLCSIKTYQVIPANMWNKVKGKNKLSARQCAVLQNLAAWREQRAIKYDRPRKWIISDDILLSLAQHQPTSLEQLANTRGLTPATVDKLGNPLLEQIQLAQQRPKDEWPSTAKLIKSSKEQDALVDSIMAIVRLCAGKAQLSPTMLTSRKDLEKFITSQQDITLFHGWRNKLAGEKVLQFINGEISLSTHKGVLTLTEY